MKNINKINNKNFTYNWNDLTKTRKFKILEELKMDHYFVDVIGGDRFDVRKPHPKPLLYCVETYQSSNAKTLMIGDSSNDVEAARRAEVDCIVVSYGYNHGEDIQLCQPQQVVDNLTELLT